MSVSILRIKDKDGKWTPIEAIRGDDGLTPYIKYATWWIGDIDTGVRAEVQESTIMATGSYVGTGTDDAVSLYFDFVPKLLILYPYLSIFAKNDWGVSFEQKDYSQTGLTHNKYIAPQSGVSATFSDHSVTINGENAAGANYRYIALGNGIFLDGDEVEY
jgi:hypothetical protein